MLIGELLPVDASLIVWEVISGTTVPMLVMTALSNPSSMARLYTTGSGECPGCCYL